MELLLNLIWLTLAVGTVFAFLRGRRVSAWLVGVPCRKSLVALACIAVLLFPIVSASDDLHPTQAVMEDAAKRVRVVAPLHLLRTTPPLPMLPALLAFCLMCALVVLQLLRAIATTASVLKGAIVPSAGRAPPLLQLNPCASARLRGTKHFLQILYRRSGTHGSGGIPPVQSNQTGNRKS